MVARERSSDGRVAGLGNRWRTVPARASRSSFCTRFVYGRGRRDGCHRRRLGVRQVDAARPAAGLDQPSAGSVRLDGEEIATCSTRMPGGTARAHARFRVPVVPAAAVAQCAGERCYRSNWLANVRRLARCVPWLGRPRRMKHYPKHLSGGEQQRVALARAFAPGRN